MKIQFGLLEHSPAWEQVLMQEGVPFDKTDTKSELSTDNFSVIIVNRPIRPVEKNTLERYLRNGGAILGAAAHLSGLGGTVSLRERLEYLVADLSDSRFGVGLLDVGFVGHIPREANVLRTQSNIFALFAGRFSDGYAVVLPFDVAELMTDARSVPKRFYTPRERMPSEKVAAVGKGELLHLLHHAFEYLHHVRGLPYAHLWYYPAGRQSIAAVRIDTDSASRHDIDAMYRIAVDMKIGMSWFLDVKAHEQWLSHFGFMASQEIGVHCYDHQVFPSYEQNLKNIAKARRLMEAEGLPSEGFAAPFGIWNPGLAEAVDELGFAYASEFALAYDALPLYPETMGIVYNTLQMPIHPVSIGSLQRVGFSEANMRDYFRLTIAHKLARREPLFFYHHPVHRAFEVVKFVAATVQEQGIETVTLGEYARWWKQRLLCKSTVKVDGQRLSCTLEHGRSITDKPWLRVSRDDGQEAIVPMSPALNLTELPWKQTPVYQPPADLRRTREFDARSMLGDLYNEMMRKFS